MNELARLAMQVEGDSCLGNVVVRRLLRMAWLGGSNQLCSAVSSTT